MTPWLSLQKTYRIKGNVMIVLIFCLLLICLITQLFNARKLTLIFLTLVLIVASFWFLHHITNHLNIDL
jgi:hypothetical protein